ncbi:hypothetical protein K0U27_09485 [archaeon]|nr:hypothetical protein [archaeon]
MHHDFYADGTAEKISWVIQTNESKAEQSRMHAEMYKNHVTNIQSKHIALHVGLFWGIGTFIIKNDDSVKIMLDEKIMHENLTTDMEIKDSTINKKIHFIKQLIAQRKLKVTYEVINPDNNLARKNT